jgi:aerobic carbon-monoxide dehydrogenase medium subunit
MIPDEFEYARPSSLAEALQLLADRGEDAKVLAGGHSLIPLMKMRLARPALLVDIGHITELRGIQRDATGLRIGAATTHAEIASSAVVAEVAPALSQAAGLIGDRQVRARGTIGGSIAHNDPAADLPAALLALDAQVVARSASGERVIPAASFFRGMLDADLSTNELVTEIRVPAAPRSAYVKMPNPASHYAIVGVAAVQANGGTRIGITGAAPVAYRSAGAESALAGKALTSDVIADASSKAHDGRELLSDIHASAEYRAHLIGVMTKRALQSLI